MADAIVRVTNWLILPLRRVLPPVAKVDTATVVAVLASAAARTAAQFALLAASASATPLLFLRITVARSRRPHPAGLSVRAAAVLAHQLHLAGRLCARACGCSDSCASRS